MKEVIQWHASHLYILLNLKHLNYSSVKYVQNQESDEFHCLHETLKKIFIDDFNFFKDMFGHAHFLYFIKMMWRA